MRLKLDENIGRRAADVLTAAGHDVATVLDEGLRGVADQQLFDVCCHERRVLITLDRDFGQVLRSPPEQSAGIVVVDLGPRPSSANVVVRLRGFLSVLETRSPAGELWIVEPGRVRIHLGERDE